MLYWLSPWRLYHAGFLWEPGMMFLPAAIHLGSCWLLRPSDGPASLAKESKTETVRLAASIALGIVLVGSLQIHASFVVLVAATLGLAATRRIRPLVPNKSSRPSAPLPPVAQSCSYNRTESWPALKRRCTCPPTHR